MSEGVAMACEVCAKLKNPERSLEQSLFPRARPCSGRATLGADAFVAELLVFGGHPRMAFVDIQVPPDKPC